MHSKRKKLWILWYPCEQDFLVNSSETAHLLDGNGRKTGNRWSRRKEFRTAVSGELVLASQYYQELHPENLSNVDELTNLTPCADSIDIIARAASSAARRTLLSASPKQTNNKGKSCTIYGSNNLPIVLKTFAFRYDLTQTSNESVNIW